jgi:Ser/Thr protein kinase RdoA (MazF antagonist)
MSLSTPCWPRNGGKGSKAVMPPALDPVFPVTKSFLSAGDLSEVVAAEYGLPDASCQLITATLRDVYLVTAGGTRHVLYVYRHGQRSMDEIKAEWQFVDHLAANGVPVAPAIPRRNGELLLTFRAPEGKRHGVLTQYVPGKHLRQRPGAGAVRAYGRIVAQIHVLADALPGRLRRPVIGLEEQLIQWVAAFAAEVQERPEDVALLQAAAAVLLPKVNPLPKEKPYYGLIHGDVIRANAQVGDDGAVTVLDFDFCGYGWRAYDVASYLAVIRGLPEELESERAFLEGYQEIRVLRNIEKSTLPVFEAVRTIFSIGIPALNVHHWGSAYLYSYLDQDLDRLRLVMDRINEEGPQKRRSSGGAFLKA